MNCSMLPSSGDRLVRSGARASRTVVRGIKTIKGLGLHGTCIPLSLRRACCALPAYFGWIGGSPCPRGFLPIIFVGAGSGSAGRVESSSTSRSLPYRGYLCVFLPSRARSPVTPSPWSCSPRSLDMRSFPQIAARPCRQILTRLPPSGGSTP